MLDINKSDTFLFVFFCCLELPFCIESQTNRSKEFLTCQNYDDNLNESNFVGRDPISGTQQCCQRCDINLTRDRIIFCGPATL